MEQLASGKANKQNTWFVVSADLHGINTPNMADFKLPTGQQPDYESPENLAIGSCEPAWTSLNISHPYSTG